MGITRSLWLRRGNGNPLESGSFCARFVQGFFSPRLAEVIWSCRIEFRRCRSDQPVPSSHAAVGGPVRGSRELAVSPPASRGSAHLSRLCRSRVRRSLFLQRGVCQGPRRSRSVGLLQTLIPARARGLPQLQRMGLEGGRAAFPGLCGCHAGCEGAVGVCVRFGRDYSALQFPLQVAAGVVPRQNSPPGRLLSVYMPHSYFKM